MEVGGPGVRRCPESERLHARSVRKPFVAASAALAGISDFSMSLQALNSLCLCVNRIICSVAFRFTAQAQCIARSCFRGGCFEVSCLAGVSASVCAGVFFVGPVVQSARFGELELYQTRSKSRWRHSRANFGCVARTWQLLCVTGAAL